MPIGALSLGSLVRAFVGGIAAAPAPTKTETKETKTPDTPRPDGSAAVEILKRYDVRQITPREFSDMLRELRDSGHLTDADFQELGRIRLEIDKNGHSPDETLDLLEMFRQRLSAQQTIASRAEESGREVGADPESVRKLRDHVSWLEKLAALHQREPELVELDTSV